MRNSIKAALAATAGAGLLLGGAGSLAYWNDATEVQPDTTLTSGTLDLGAPTCASWKLDDDSDFTPASDTIVPGDSLTRTCQFQISATGDHLTAQLSANVPSMHMAPYWPRGPEMGKRSPSATTDREWPCVRANRGS